MVLLLSLAVPKMSHNQTVMNAGALMCVQLISWNFLCQTSQLFSFRVDITDMMPSPSVYNSYVIHQLSPHKSITYLTLFYFHL